MLGRPLSTAERGCAQAHQKAVSKNFQDIHPTSGFSIDWVLVAEDDADLTQSMLLAIETELTNLRYSRATLISFCATNKLRPLFGWPKVGRPSRVVFPRPGTVLYAINLPGLDLLNKQGFSTAMVRYVADFPPVFAQMVFRISGLRVAESGALSLVGERHNSSLTERILLHSRQMWNLELISDSIGLSKMRVFSWLIIFPALRDTLFRLRCKSPHKL
jgi:hypothetical protein